MGEFEAGNNSCVTPSQVRQRFHNNNKKKSNNDKDKSSSKSSTQYQLKQVIGKGSYGIVYKAENKTTGQIVAIKEINYDNDDDLKEIMIEINLLKNLNHINIVKYHGFIQKMSNLYIILEYAAKGSLKTLMSNRPRKCLTESETEIYIRQTLNGLAYLHDKGVIHRDIKAANLLLDANNIVKLADFGVSTKVNNSAMTLAGSLNWMAPEIITNKGASTLSDIWSLGATVVELLTGKPPYHNLLDINIYYAMENKDEQYYPPASLSKESKEFLKLCLQKNMFERSTAKDLLNHPWIKAGFNKDDKLSKYKEDFMEEENNWDADFKEKEIDDLFNIFNNSPRKMLINSSPLKSLPLKKINGYDENFDMDLKNSTFTKGRNRLPIMKSDYKNPFENYQNIEERDINTSDYTADIDDSLLYDGYYYLNAIQDDENSVDFKDLADDRINNIFTECSMEDIIETFFDLLQKDKISKNTILGLARILANDFEVNNSKLIESIISFGGGPLLTRNNDLLLQWYSYQNDKDEFLKIILRNGIMNMHRIDNFKSSTDFYFELIHKYLEFTSMKFWYKWCDENIDPNLLVESLYTSNSKKIQSIILKLASFDNNINKGGNFWLFKKILPLIVEHSVTDNSQTTYIVFKTVTYLLQLSPTNTRLHDLATKNNITRENSISSVAGTVSTTPLMNSPVKPQRILSNQYFKPLKINYDSKNINDRHVSIEDLESRSKLPRNFSKWLFNYLDTVEKFLINNDVDNIHVWKYFIKVCYISSKIDKNILYQLMESKKFVKLINFIVNRYEETLTYFKNMDSKDYKPSNKVLKKQDQRNLKSIIQTSILLLVDISRLSNHKRDINLSYIYQMDKIIFNITNNYEEFLPLCIEYLSNVIINDTFIDHNNKDQEILVNTLSSAFYRFEAEDSNFNLVINKFINLFSLSDDKKGEISKNVSKKIIYNPGFIDRIKLFFKLYENSLLIQIELLKLIKLLFTRYNQNRSIINQMSSFLQVNWKRDNNGSSSSRQVGRDSILIIQLCKDIASM